MQPKTALLKSCLFATAVSIVLTFAFFSSWPSGKQALHLRLPTFWLFETEVNHISRQPWISKDPSLQTTCLTYFCCHSTASWNLRLLSAERGQVDLLAGACGLKRLYWRVICLQQLSRYRWHLHFCVVGQAANRLCHFWSRGLAADLLTFWDREEFHLHAALHIKRLIRSDHMLVVFQLSFHSLKSLTSVSWVGQSWPASLCGHKRIYWRVVCLRQLPICISLLLAKRETCAEFLKHSATYWPFDFLKSREILFPCRLAYPKTHDFRPHAWLFFIVIPQPPDLWLLSAERGKCNLLAGACGAQNGFADELFVCDSCLSTALAFEFVSCWPSGKQALTFLKHSAAEQTFWLFETEGNSISMESCIPKGPWLQTTCLTFLCSHSTAPWNGACVDQNGSTEELFVCDSCLYSVDVCILLFLAEWQTGSEFAATDLLTFWDRGESHFQAALDIQRPITSDHMPDLFLLSF